MFGSYSHIKWTLGDSCGKYTFFGYESNSVIDYTLVDKQLLSKVQCFKVHNFTGITNHCKIETILACSPKRLENNNQTTETLDFVKYTWEPNASPEKLSAILMSTEFSHLKNNILSSQYEPDANATNKHIVVERPCSKPNCMWHDKKLSLQTIKMT